VARNGLGGFGDGDNGYVTAIVAAEISAVAMGQPAVLAAVHVMDSSNAAVVA
jgi:hypothetical protein